MKKVIKKILKFFLFLIILICVAVGIFILLLTDNNINEPAYLENAEPVEFNANEILSKGLIDTQKNKKIEFGLSEQDLSIILKGALLELNGSLKSLNVNIVTAYVDIKDDNQMTFKAHFSAFNLMSSITGEFSYGFENDELTISLDNMKVGHIGVSASLVTTFINPLEVNSTINEQMKDTGINFNLNNENLILTLSLSNVKQILLDQLGSSSDTTLFRTLLSLMFRVDNMISLNESADELGLDFDISKLCFNQNTDTEMPYNVDYNVISQKLEKLLKHELISVEDVDIVGTYLAKGYDKLTANERSKIDALNLSRIDINENNKYRGIYKYNVQTIEEIFTNEINRVYNKLPNFDGIKLTESDFNGLLLQNNLVGGMFCFVREEAGEYKVSYIAVESVYVDLKDNHFAIYLTMSINGQSVVVNMEIDAPKANGFKVNGTIESLRFGSEMLNNDEITSLLTYLSAAVNDSWITIDADSKSIVVDFTSTLSGIPMFSEIVDFFTVLYPDKQLSTKFVDGTILITL